MEEMGLGPNGGLVYCFEFLLENLDFLTEALDGLTEEYLIIFDMPGQIELYTHIPILPSLVRFLGQPGALDIRLCATYLLEATFVVDRAKFFSGTLSAMSAMMLLEVPHLNILSKMDLVKGQVRKRDIKRFLTPDASLLDDDPTDLARRQAVGEGPSQEAGEGDADVDADVDMDAEGPDEDVDPAARDAVMRGASFKRLNKAVAGLIESFSMVNYLRLDSSDEDSVGAILSYVDDCVQYHEAQEPKELKDEEFDEPEE